jgi:hypothetical protein
VPTSDTVVELQMYIQMVFADTYPVILGVYKRMVKVASSCFFETFFSSICLLFRLLSSIETRNRDDRL